MKSEIYTECETAPHYPILAEYIHKHIGEDERFVAMFIDCFKGVVIHRKPKSPYNLGDISNFQYTWRDKTCWRVLSDKESVCLNNTWGG